MDNHGTRLAIQRSRETRGNQDKSRKQIANVRTYRNKEKRIWDGQTQRAYQKAMQSVHHTLRKKPR